MYDILKVDLMSTDSDKLISECFKLDNELTKLHIDIYKQYTNHPLPKLYNSIQEFKQSLMQRDSQLYVFMDTEIDNVIGCAILNYDTVVKSRVCNINSLIINSAIRNHKKGVGTEFLNKITNVAKLEGCAYLQLRCALDNGTAMRFYRKNGFINLNNTLYMSGISKFISSVGFKSIPFIFNKMNKEEKTNVKTLISDSIETNATYRKLRIPKDFRVKELLQTVSDNESSILQYHGRPIGIYSYYSKSTTCFLLSFILNKQTTDKLLIKRTIVHLLKNIYKSTRINNLFYNISSDDITTNELFNSIGFKTVSCIMYKTI